jgi:hypothetical protein
MDPITKYLHKIAYKFPKGYPDMDDPKDKAMLNEMINNLIKEDEEEDLKSKLISIINSSDLSDDEIKAYTKSISNRGLTGELKDKLNKKGYSSKSFKVGDKAMSYVIDKITDSEAKEFIDYTPVSFKSAPEKGNFSKITGLSQPLVQDLINIEPGADAGGSAIGKGELFLALAFNDIDNRGGGGDLNFEGKNLEVKGTGGRLGQQGGRGSDFDYLGFLGDKYLEGDELDEFLNDSRNKLINYSIKEIFDKVDGNKSLVIKDIQKALDGVYFNKGLAKKYFNGPADFEDLAEMKIKLTKLNAEAYAQKTNVGSFIFMNSKTGDYVYVDVDDLNASIDSGLFGTIVKDPIKGYQWNNPHPNMIIR